MKGLVFIITWNISNVPHSCSSTRSLSTHQLPVVKPVHCNQDVQAPNHVFKISHRLLRYILDQMSDRRIFTPQLFCILILPQVLFVSWGGERCRWDRIIEQISSIKNFQYAYLAEQRFLPTILLLNKKGWQFVLIRCFLETAVGKHLQGDLIERKCSLFYLLG